MQRGAQKLTVDEKQKSEIQREIFVVIRLIDMVEKCVQLSDDRITAEEHQKQIGKLLNKLQTFQGKVPNFNLDRFVQDYQLEDCKFGLDRIKQGAPKVQSNNQIQLVKELAQLFYQLQDQMLALQDNPKVSELRPLTEDLIDLLGRAVGQLPPYTSYLKELRDLQIELQNQYKNSNQNVLQKKYVMDVLTEQEYSEMSTLLDSAQRNFLSNK